MILIATCLEETKSTLVAELRRMGVTNILDGYMSVEFEVSEEQFYLCHLRLRTASQIHLRIKKIPAKSMIILNSQTKRVAWEKIFSQEQTYRVDAIAGDRGEDKMSSNEISKTVRLAIENRFQHKLNLTPKVSLKEPDVIINAYLYEGRCTLSVNTSGLTLHKRGYKNDSHPAPVKETLASIILDLIPYNGEEALYDPMCGSGTFVIEAAMKALNKGVNIHRKKGNFAFERLKMFNSKVYKKIQDRVRSEKIESLKFPIYASDIDGSYVTSAQDNSLRARVEKHIDFKVGSFFEFKKPEDNGLLVTNLPYGDRIGPEDKDQLEGFYTEVGNHLKKNFTGWKAAIFVAESAPWKKIGLKPSKKINLRNGSIKTKLLIYEMYTGSKKQRDTKQISI